MGSSADVGSSMSRISGFIARARAMHSRCCWPPERVMADLFKISLTSSQRTACRQTVFHQFIQIILVIRPHQTRTISDVVINSLGKRIRFLKNHADFFAYFHRIDIRRINILTFKENFSFHSCSVNQIIHSDLKTAAVSTCRNRKGR